MLSETEIKALGNICYGLYIVGSHNGEEGDKRKINAQLVNTVFQVTLTPPQIVVSIHKENLTHEYIKKSKVLTVCAIKKGADMTFIGPFGFRSGRDYDKFEKVKYEIGTNGAPIVLENVLSAFELKVKQEVDVGTHTLFIGEVCCCRNLAEGEPLTYKYYKKVLKGKDHARATHKE